MQENLHQDCRNSADIAERVRKLCGKYHFRKRKPYTKFHIKVRKPYFKLQKAIFKETVKKCLEFDV